MSTQRKLRSLYAQVPDVGCKGLCAEACGVIPLTEPERRHIAGVIWHDPGEFMATETLTCPQLKDGRCSIYADRPLLCRLYGATPKLRCPYGCEPTMTEAQAGGLIERLLEVK